MNLTKWTHISYSKIDNLYDKKQRIMGIKPEGLWLSRNNEWLEWQSDSDYIANEDNYKTFTSYELSDRVIYYEMDISGLNLLKIDSREILIDLIKKSCWDGNNIDIQLPKEHIEIFMDWNKISTIYDGIMILNYHYLKNSILEDLSYIPRMSWFLGVDINCCCIWNASKITSFTQINK